MRPPPKTSPPPINGHLAALWTAACLLALSTAPSAPAADTDPPPPFIKENERVLFLGDSITQGGTYIAYLQAWLYTEYPGKTFDIINLGLSSETASGLSEADHPFPRPCIHERLDRALAKTQPKVTFICYGMNDGIYHPLSDERFQAYQAGMNKLIEKVQAAGSKVVLLTPPPFDAETRRLKGKPLNPSDADEHGYKTPYEKYDNVLEAYARWVLEQKDRVDLVIDIHTPMEAATAKRRAADPAYLSGDGVHPNAAGHFVMTRTILEALGAPGLDRLPDYAALPPGSPLQEPLDLVIMRQKILSSSWREDVGHNRPGNKTNILPLPIAHFEATTLDTRIRTALAELAD